MLLLAGEETTFEDAGRQSQVHPLDGKNSVSTKTEFGLVAKFYLMSARREVAANNA